MTARPFRSGRRLRRGPLTLWYVVALLWGMGDVADATEVVTLQGAAERAAPPPRVRLIATGGTIANRAGARLTARQLVGMVPRLSRYATAEAEQFTNVASNALTLRDWVRLSARVNELFERRSDLVGIVVSTGTDTLEETAFLLHLTVRSARPVVVVGAMRRPQTLGYDGAANLRQAFRVAASPDARDRGVLVVLNGEIHSARDVTKSDAHRLDAFSSPAAGPLGLVDDEAVHFLRRLTRRHTHRSQFRLAASDELPRVDVLLAYQEAPGDLVHAAVSAGARGLVLAGTGAGSPSPRQREALRTVRGNGVPVVVTTRTGAGRVSRRAPDDEDSPSRAPQIAGEDHSPVKARVLLMLGLEANLPPTDLQRLFTDY